MRSLLRWQSAVVLAFLGYLAGTIDAQTAGSAKDRLANVNKHLTRYVVLTNSDHQSMQLAPQMESLHVPAISMAAIREGHIDWAAAYGVTSLGSERATTRTLFGAASMSKPVTAVGVLKLVEDGKIGLDTDVNQYLKRWKIPDNAFTREKKVTVRELLNHTSGIGTHNGAIYDPSQAVPTFLQLLDGEKPTKTPPVRVEATPGTKFAYSNGGYLVLALLIEDVTGQKFADYMKRAVLDPIGMKDSTFEAPLPPGWAKRGATGYWEDGKSGIPPAKFVEPNLAAGGLWSTPTDMAKFLIEVQREYEGRSHKVLHQRTVQLLAKPGLGGWGLGFRVGGSAGNPVLSHEGSALFQDDMLIYLQGNGFVAMTSGGDGGQLADELVRSAGTIYDFPDFRALERTPVEVSPKTLSRYPGRYGFVKVAMEGSKLMAEIPEGSRAQTLFAESPTHFFVLDGPQELEFDVTGEQANGVEFITPMGRHHLDRTEPNQN
ncbi:MAG TPA: serine hydrolase [Lacipirellulaceae bacterium]|nr:serine hydrolase [Lacipirellulaceae bacterium]